MKLALEILAVTFAGILPALLGTYISIRYPEQDNRASILDNLIIRLVNSLLAIFVVLLVAYNQPEGFASIGLLTDQGGENGGAIFIGALTMYMFLFLITNVLGIIYTIKRKENPLEFDRSKPSPSEFSRYQNRWERLSYLSVLPVAAISEDLVYRGYLILLLGNLTNNFVPWVVLSITLSILAHLYQGRNKGTIIFHFLYATMFVVLTLATSNILAPISGHIFHNLYNSARVWQQAKDQELSVSSEISKREKISYAIFIAVNVVILVTMAIYFL